MCVDVAKNETVVRKLCADATLKADRLGQLWVTDGYEWHAHPDLVERLKDLKSYTPDARFQFIFGIPALCASNGRIFATAAGTSSLHLFLPDVTEWGQPYPEYGESWRRGFAWVKGRESTQEDENGIVSFVRLAYCKANIDDQNVR
jgi:hypothetical protein